MDILQQPCAPAPPANAEAGPSTISSASSSFSQVVAGCERIVSGADRLADIVESCDNIGRDLVRGKGQPGLKRCIANLVENAVRYGGSVRILVADDARHVRIEVRDRGPGIPPELLDRVFEPFFRL